MFLLKPLGYSAVALAAINFQAMSIGQIAIFIVILAAVVALVLVALKQFGIEIPEWVKHVLWICVIALVIILAIRFVMSL